MNLSKLKLVFSLAILASCMFFFNSCSKEKEDLPAPTPGIISFSPDQGVAGDEITITGENFSTTASENTVRFNGTSAMVTSATVTKLVVTAPEGATAGKLTISVNGQSVTSTHDFTILEAPVVSSFSPESGVAGDEVTINGENFSPTTGENNVKFNGVTATVVAASATTLTVLVPAGASTGKVQVRINDKTTESSIDFTVKQAPTITGVSPTSASAGTEITITGENFGLTAEANSVSFNGVEATIVSASATSLVVIVPQGALSGNITVTADGFTAISTNSFSIILAQIVQLAAGGSHTLLVKDDNTLWAFGWNGYGQLGDGTTTDASAPKLIMGEVRAVAAGTAHTFILKTDNTLWATGVNTHGQLGDGTNSHVYAPKQIMENVGKIFSKYNQTMILKLDNTLWATGYNAYGQLGTGSSLNLNTPVRIMENVKSVDLGTYHSFILKNDNTLWAAGRNNHGQLGDGTQNNNKTTTHKKIAEKVISVAAGANHSLWLKDDNTVWACGHNEYGQVANNTSGAYVKTPVVIDNNIVAISAGAYHTLLLRNDKALLAAGRNDYGQLGTGTNDNWDKPYNVQMPYSITNMTGGLYRTIMLKDDNTLWGTGRNENGQLGIGSTTDTSTPVQITF